MSSMMPTPSIGLRFLHIGHGYYELSIVSWTCFVVDFSTALNQQYISCILVVFLVSQTINISCHTFVFLVLQTINMY